MTRGAVHLVGWRELHDLPCVHHRNPVAHVIDHAQIVGDQQVGKAQLRLEVLKQGDDLRLHRDVKRREGLVGHYVVRMHGQGAGDADALTLASAELVRISVEMLPGQTHPLYELHRLLPAPLTGHSAG